MWTSMARSQGNSCFRRSWLLRCSVPERGSDELGTRVGGGKSGMREAGTRETAGSRGRAWRQQGENGGSGGRRQRREGTRESKKVRFDPRFTGSRPCLHLYQLGSVRLDPLIDFRSGPCSRKVRTAPLQFDVLLRMRRGGARLRRHDSRPGRLSCMLDARPVSSTRCSA
jgi:hypothetical protein